jgi:cytidylate kinase
MARRTVCISLVTAAEGDAIGRGVARALGYRYLDEEIIALAADRGHVDAAAVASVEHRTSLIHRLVDALFATPILEGHYFPLAGSAAETHKPVAVHKPRSDELRGLIREAIHVIAERGDAVIVAHAASFALGARLDVLRVMVTAGLEARTRRLWLSGKFLSEDEARVALAESDRERAHYLHRFYDVREELPTHYDVAVNTDGLTVDQATAIVVAAARA